MDRDNNILESYKSLVENREKRAQLAAEQRNKELNARKDFMSNYNSIMESRRENSMEHSRLLENAKNEAFADTLKAIYITALEPDTLTDNALYEAENIVDKYIKENGGATKIFNSKKADTYLLARLRAIVENTANAMVNDIENVNESYIENINIEMAIDEGQEIEKVDPEILKKTLDSMGFKIVKIDNPEEEEESEEDMEEISDRVEDISDDGEENNSNKDDDIEDDEDDVEDSEDEIKDEENSNDSDESEDEVEDDEFKDDEELEYDPESETVNKDPKKNMFDELDKEKEVKDAIELIKTRVSNAEEAFIKRNAEDKKKIEELLGKISDNVKTVEKIADNKNPKSKIAQESAIMYKRQINEISNNKSLTVLERMTRNLTGEIINDANLKNNYLTESGSLDIDLIVEAAKVMYGFMETLNTLQLEDINSDYITKILNN